MKESYRFYQNKACEYFPCHPVDDPDSFNCLFCYCPLYLQEKCLGSPEWILSGKGQKIKDCSNCMVVHRPEMYDKVLAQLCRQDFTVSVNVWNFRNEIWRRMAQIASWDQMEAELFWQHRGAAISSVTNMMEKHKYLYCVTIKLQPFEQLVYRMTIFPLESRRFSVRCWNGSTAVRSRKDTFMPFMHRTFRWRRLPPYCHSIIWKPFRSHVWMW